MLVVGGRIWLGDTVPRTFSVFLRTLKRHGLRANSHFTSGKHFRCFDNFHEGFARNLKVFTTMSVILETSVGDITIDLFTDERPISESSS